jgi:UDP-glucose 4-epimerase
MRILVTGGAGYIGSHAAAVFAAAGHKIRVFDNLIRGHRAAVGNHDFVLGDLHDPSALDHALSGIDAVVHFAALTYVGESVNEPDRYYRNNFAGTLNLVEAMHRAGVSKLVFSSTAAVYGVPQRIPIEESDTKSPINPYGRSKLAVEWLLADHAAAFGLGFAALRYFNAAGASLNCELGEDHRPETHLIPLVLQVALGQREHIDVFGTDYPTDDGTCVRDYVHVQDLADAHLLALEKVHAGQGLCFNVGTGNGYSVREVIAACERVTGKSIKTRFGPPRAGDPPFLVASPSKIRSALGWRAKHSELEQIVETAWRWLSKNPQGYAAG